MPNLIRMLKGFNIVLLVLTAGSCIYCNDWAPEQADLFIDYYFDQVLNNQTAITHDQTPSRHILPRTSQDPIHSPRKYSGHPFGTLFDSREEGEKVNNWMNEEAWEDIYQPLRDILDQIAQLPKSQAKSEVNSALEKIIIQAMIYGLIFLASVQYALIYVITKAKDPQEKLEMRFMGA